MELLYTGDQVMKWDTYQKRFDLINANLTVNAQGELVANSSASKECKVIAADFGQVEVEALLAA